MSNALPIGETSAVDIVCLRNTHSIVMVDAVSREESVRHGSHNGIGLFSPAPVCYWLPLQRPTHTGRVVHGTVVGQRIVEWNSTPRLANNRDCPAHVQICVVNNVRAPTEATKWRGTNFYALSERKLN